MHHMWCEQHDLVQCFFWPRLWNYLTLLNWTASIILLKWHNSPTMMIILQPWWWQRWWSYAPHVVRQKNEYRQKYTHKSSHIQKKMTTTNDKMLLSSSWCGFSTKAKEQLKTNPIEGLKVIECDLEKENPQCVGLPGYPTWKHCDASSGHCSVASGHMPADKLQTFFRNTSAIVICHSHYSLSA